MAIEKYPPIDSEIKKAGEMARDVEEGIAEGMMSDNEGKASEARKKIADFWESSGHIGKLFMGHRESTGTDYIYGEIDGKRVDIEGGTAAIDGKVITGDLVDKLRSKYSEVAGLTTSVEPHYAEEAAKDIANKLDAQREKERIEANVALEEETRKIAETLL